MEEVIDIQLAEFIQQVKPKKQFNNEIIVIPIDGASQPGDEVKDYTIRIDAYSCLLVTRGEITLTADYLPYRLNQNMVLELTNKHLLNSIHVAHDTEGYFLLFSKNLFTEFMTQVYTIPRDFVMYKRFNPVLKLDGKDFRLLTGIIERLRTNIARKDHVFQRTLVVNEASNFIMEVSDMGMREASSFKTDYKMSNNDDIVMRFVQLIVSNGREWHEVSQYSTELCVTPVYLSRAIKTASGKTVMEWINEARISESKILLRRRNITINEIAELLHFSDQSAFGKFFKKHTGLSPLEYRRNIN